MSSSVHRISVREMNEIQCRRQLAVTRKMFQQWQKMANTTQYHRPRIEQIFTLFQQLSANDISTISARQLTTLKNELTQFSATLKQEIQTVREQQLEQRALAARTNAHRQHNLEALAALVREKLPAEKQLITELESRDVKGVGSLIFRALTALDNVQSQLSPFANQLLEQLKAQSEDVPQFWQYGAPLSPYAKQCEQILLMIEKLKLVGYLNEALSAQQQLAEIQSMNENPQRHLRADSLILILAKQLKESQQHTELVEKVEQLCAELAIFSDDENAKIIDEALASIHSSSVTGLMSLAEQLEAKINLAEQAFVAEAQRRTVLDGLGKLGYQIQETDVRAWMDNGKVVVRHPATPGYGLELGGKQARFQTRTVALSSQRDTQRDKDVDAIWCSQHQQLQEFVAQSDAELVVERALPAGSNEMKVYDLEDAGQQRNTATNQQPRTLRK
ncbi:hypothetical protein MMK73_004891 [Providencia rettgeri]|uniref:hypothetical protein n=1 Tax=Providencia sp. TaxID=589 RepID=UPI0024AB33AF|nr:hypothetical protein [Providencia rettgeri]